MSTREAELIDIEEIDQRPKVNFCTPKLMVLTVFASYFVAQNIYHYLKNPPKPVQNFKPVEIDEWKQFWQLYDRFQGYIVVAIVGFLAFYYLRRYNDRIEQAQFQKEQQKRLQQQEKQRRLQSQRQERIIRKMQEQQRLQNEKQIAMGKTNSEKSGSEGNRMVNQKYMDSYDKKND